MSTGLMLTSVVLMEWLLIVAEITGQFQYYAWAFLVMVLWSEAVNTRNPRLYPNRIMRIAFFSVYFFAFLMVNKSFVWIQQNGLPLQQQGGFLIDIFSLFR